MFAIKYYTPIKCRIYKNYNSLFGKTSKTHQLIASLKILQIFRCNLQQII